MKLKKLLIFLSLADSESNLSLTNLSVLLFLVKALFVSYDWTDTVGLVAVLLNYSYKRFQIAKEDSNLDLMKDLKALSSQVSELALQIEGYKEIQIALEKQAEDTKRLLSTNAVGSAFGVRR